MDKDVMKNLIKNVDFQLFEIVNNLICSICQELFYKPVTTPCGHSFCNKCIKRVLSSKDNSGCPLCKNPVKRYGLEADEVKSTLTKICQELPAAFEKDVKELTNNLTGLEEDLIRASKLSQIQNQEYAKDSNNKKQRSVAKRKVRKTDELKLIENDSETFIPVLKRTKNVLEYTNAKKKKMEDFISVSQTEPASNSSLCDSSELDKKLKKIEKIPLEKKVSEWFNSVGDNIYINSPGLSILETDSKNHIEGDKSQENKLTMIRRDYNKSGVCFKNKEENSKLIDPYEFIPSQNNKALKKKTQKRSTRKKVPDFRALQRFSKESIKRSSILLSDSKEESYTEEEAKSMKNEKQITASQKFDQLLSESKMEEKKTHTLYSASQSPSTRFLDVSFNSKVEKIKNKETSNVQEKKTEEENILFKNITEENKSRRSSRSKRKRSADMLKNKKRKKLLSETIDMSKDEASQLEKSTERYLIGSHEEIELPSTKLETLLKELLDDDMIYATRPGNAPVRLPDLGVVHDDAIPQNHPENDVTQNTKLIGFCTQEETPDEKIFKKMVENMEKELNLGEYLVEESERKGDCQFRRSKFREENSKTNSLICEGENNSHVSVESEKKIQKTRLVRFLHLGRLTPIRKRTKSTVVKLVFPIGLTSLARRRPFESKGASLATVPKKQTSQMSMGIQTSQLNVSSFVQTSQVPKFSVNLQTSQEGKPSVEIQTTQKLTSSAEIQTSQRFVCQEIQTTQIGCKSMQVQTTQIQCQHSPNSNTEMFETHTRKLSNHHWKKTHRKNSEESVLNTSHRLPEKQSPADKDLIMDFGTEKEFEETWRETQKHEHLVELKNKKNKEKCESLVNDCRKWADTDSDDSDIQPPKKRHSFKIFSQNSIDVSNDYETRQLIPLDVRKLSQDEEMEIINLDTPGDQNSEEQMLLVLKNIDLDLPKGRSENVIRGEKSEESDSDVFVEQTPPRPASWAIEDKKNLSRIRYNVSPIQKEREIKESESYEKQSSGMTDLVSDSLPKGFSESFLVLSTPQKVSVISEKNSKNETQKKTLKIDPTMPVDLPNENDQNQLNAFDGRTKTTQLKAAIDAWKRTDLSPPVKTISPKKLCVVASSVKNLEMIKKFVSTFKIEYLNKPTKNMTHLIVGLHENDDKEMLPLCTPKLLFAMANKKWVVSELWAETCLKMDMILPEETFETLDPIGGCGCREARLSNEKLLKNYEIYLLGDFQMISKEDFADLILDCGGTIVATPEKFSFSPMKLRMIIADRDCLMLSEKQLQELYQKHSTVILSRDVIIMSIQSYKVINLHPYLLHSASEESLIKLGYPLPLVKNEDETEEDEGEDSNRSVAR